MRLSRRSVIKAGLATSAAAAAMVFIPGAMQSVLASGRLPTRLVRTFARGGRSNQVGLRSGVQIKPAGPQSLRVNSDGTFVLTDTINGRIHRWKDQGAVATTAVPPFVGPYDALDVGGRTWILDRFGDRVILAAGSSVISEFRVPSRLQGKITRLAAATLTAVEAHVADYATVQLVASGVGVAADHDASEKEFTRAMRQRADEEYVRVELAASPGDRGQIATVVRPHRSSLKVTSVGRLYNAWYLGTDAADNTYVVVDQELAGGRPSKTVWRASGDEWDAIAELPLDGTIHVPRNPIALAPDGRVFGTYVTENAVEIHELLFVKFSLAQAQFASRSPSWLGAPSAMAATVAPPERGLQTLTRNQAIALADAYNNTQWWCNSANWNGNSAARGKPAFLTTYDVYYDEIPYKWGGWQTISGFLTDMNNNLDAGDVTTGATLSDASGVDCSGFIQRCWDLNSWKHADFHLIGPEYCTQLSDWYAQQPGDVMDKYDVHIAMNYFNVVGGAYVYQAVGDDGRVRLDYYDFNSYAAAGYLPFRCNILA